MSESRAIVITSISGPNAVMQGIAEQARRGGDLFLVVGDSKSPESFTLPGATFLSLDDQRKMDLQFPKLCPVRHYARKNVGYLRAMMERVEIIVETDDDNIPRPAFYGPRERMVDVAGLDDAGWVNVYRYFSDAPLWPRGLPLDAVRLEPAAYDGLPVTTRDCPIQQGLADENPDVDAVYRLVYPLPQNFRNDRRVALGKRSWCPFNSQNTTWWPDAFELMYLPAYCSFRMTDIWRSFVAQRIAWECGWSILFHEPTVHQERNEHDLMQDFADEVPGYLHNRRLCELLGDLPLGNGVHNIAENLLVCYEHLVAEELIGRDELPLLEAWLDDVQTIRSGLSPDVRIHGAQQRHSAGHWRQPADMPTMKHPS